LTKTASRDDALQFLQECRYNDDEYHRIAALIEWKFDDSEGASEEEGA
jgi:hypothetical protein